MCRLKELERGPGEVGCAAFRRKVRRQGSGDRCISKSNGWQEQSRKRSACLPCSRLGLSTVTSSRGLVSLKTVYYCAVSSTEFSPFMGFLLEVLDIRQGCLSMKVFPCHELSWMKTARERLKQFLHHLCKSGD